MKRTRIPGITCEPELRMFPPSTHTILSPSLVAFFPIGQRPHALFVAVNPSPSAIARAEHFSGQPSASLSAPKTVPHFPFGHALQAANAACPGLELNLPAGQALATFPAAGQ